MNERNTENVNLLRPLEVGDAVRIDGTLWHVCHDMSGWELRLDAKAWRTVHPTVHSIQAQLPFIVAVQAAVNNIPSGRDARG